MRYLKQSPLFLFTFLALLLSGCGGIFCADGYTYREQIPVYVQLDDVRRVENQEAREIVKPGKIYLHHDLILISEVEEGIHVLDNSDPTNPVNIAFIAIPGNHDLLVREDETGTVLYADNYTDLVALDFSNPREVTLLKRLESAFENLYPQEDDRILVGYKEGRLRRVCGVVAEPAPAPPSDGGSGDGGGGSQGGSLARFAALESYLYTIDGDQIQSFHLETLDDPTFFNRVPVDFGIETLFPYPREAGNQLYVGGNQGMYIMDASSPGNLRKVGEITHVQSCDPVVVQGDLAYVTLQGSCFGERNRLEVIDVSEPSSPELIVDYPLQEPYGLGVDDDYLFVCDGEAGLKVYENAREPKNLNLIKQLGEVRARDIIPYNGVAIVIAENGFFQYDYSSLAEGEMTLLSSIPVVED